MATRKPVKKTATKSRSQAKPKAKAKPRGIKSV